MLNEEKKAIKMIEHIQECNTLIGYRVEDRTILAKALLNLIEKQQKETEELKNEIMEKELIIDGMKEDRRIAVEEIKEQYFISKDKIKEILEIEEKIDNEKLLSLLQTIVDENARLEDIEDRKVQIEYNNVFNKGVKSVEDKIKAKIEELDKMKSNGEYTILFNSDNVMEVIKAVLQSLLKKE